MRLATIRHDGGTRAAIVEEGRTRLLPHTDVGTLLSDIEGRPIGELSGTPGPSPQDAVYAPLVPRPSKILCVGLNYKDHIAEMGRETPEYPTLFGKFADTLLGAEDDLVLPAESGAVDWEAELVVVVGRTVRHANAAEAAAAIAGYTVANDVSARDWQRRTGQWLQGKAFEATTPIGPRLHSWVW